MRRLLVMLLLVVVLPVVSAGAHGGGRVEGFENPEGALWDENAGVFYVSNIGPGPIDPLGSDPDGYLSQVSAAGRMANAKWVTGLRSPKGMDLRGGDLLVADVGQLVVVDVAGATIRSTVDLAALGAKVPNDVTVDDRTGEAYVSDTTRNAIYRIPGDGGGNPEVWLESPALDGPNGLYLDRDQLIVASYGTDPDGEGPAARSPGRILVVDLVSKKISALGDMAPLANLDGIERLGADWVVTGSDKVWRVTSSGQVTELGQISRAADLGLRPADRVAAIPTLSNNTVELVTIP